MQQLQHISLSVLRQGFAMYTCMYAYVHVCIHANVHVFYVYM
jgi:hypothetical protein